MLELIDQLPAGARVLDLGARSGSFHTERRDILVVRLDLEVLAARSAGEYVVADAARIPFQSHAFQLVIANHSLEHFPALTDTLREVSRILQPGGGFYVAVPGVTTLMDRIYRWMGRGGGHVNAFRTAEEVAGLVEQITGLAHRGTETLYTSFSFLNEHNIALKQKKLLLFANGNEGFLAWSVWLLRLFDRLFGSSLSVYGWALYFGGAEPPPRSEPWINVCVRCGSGYSREYLVKTGVIHERPGIFDPYNCPHCGGRNRLTRAG
jgi:SAM-dependent methyltransferase